MWELEGREKWMIPIMIAAGHDAPTAGEHLSGIQVVILIFFAATVGVMLWGVRGGKAFTEAYVAGARELLGVALVAGLAGGIVMIIDQAASPISATASSGVPSAMASLKKRCAGSGRFAIIT